ncbi:AraC family transcriptional regulator ligand-binding domain-containing protein [Nocardia sp. NPDC058633]|uniref:AraC family transcriptional regulator n=1 Tax=Nocardia sp. NPDC058633 TaxID=3346568 RepID=UPI0036498033
MATDQSLLHRFVISQFDAAGLDRAQLIRDTGVPDWSITGDDVHLPSATFSRLWEVGEHRLGPDVALQVARRYELSSLGLYDYLFASAPTLGAGLATCGPHITAVTTNHRFDLVAESETESTLYLEMLEGEGRGRDHTQLWGLSAVLSRARRAVDDPLNPARVSLRQAAPRDLTGFRAVFGSATLEFDAPTDSITFHAADLDLPLTTADPVLAAILRPLADALPPPPTLSSAWPERVAVAVEQAIEAGEVSLNSVARILAVSPRTLQRRLTESDTTWRAELDRARSARLSRAMSAGSRVDTRQAELLGYSDAGSLRRAARRWSAGSHPAQAIRT